MPILPKQIVDCDVWTLALERMRVIFNMHDEVAVSFSGGKDSTAVFHVALEVAHEVGRLPLRVFFADEEAIHPETIEYVRRVAEREDVAFEWYCLPIKHRNACSKKEPYWHTWDPEKEHLWCRPMPEDAITVDDLPPGFTPRPFPETTSFLHPPEKGRVAIVLGLRAAESLRRYRAVARKTHLNYISPDAMCSWVSMCKPIYDWSTEDVWTAPKKFGWDYNRAYDVLTYAGVTRHDQRVCPPYGDEPMRGLYQYKECWPELWDKMISRVRGAATAARYARAETRYYAFGNIDKPEGMTWQEAIREAITQWPEKQQKLIAYRIKQEVRNHKDKTRSNKSPRGVPIPDAEPGPSGVTWHYLYMIAVRGDLKGRRTPNYNLEANKGSDPREQL